MNKNHSYSIVAKRSGADSRPEKTRALFAPGARTDQKNAPSFARSHCGVACSASGRRKGMLAMPLDHALAALDEVPLSALQGQAFIEFRPSESRYLYEIVVGQLRANGVAPETVQTLSHTHSILALVDANVGLALVPRSFMKLRYANVCFKPTANVSGLDVEMHLAWRREGRHGVAKTLCCRPNFPLRPEPALRRVV